jgi:hypothetical protein
MLNELMCFVDIGDIVDYHWQSVLLVEETGENH